MLFKFGTFWKTALATSLSWLSWVFFGFEFTVITMIALLIVILSKERHFLV